jgi:catechol 2,3-dioxygenase-like lactoylglutathione lyase family enzyme
MSGGSVQPVTPTTPLVRTDRLDHVHLYVTDRPAAVIWYRQVLGLVPYGINAADIDGLHRDHPLFLAPATGGHHCLSLFTGKRPTGGDRTVAFHADGAAFLRFAAALPAPNLLARDGTPLTTAKHHDYGMAITFNFLDPAGNHLELVSYDHDQVRAGLAAA